MRDINDIVTACVFNFPMKAANIPVVRPSMKDITTGREDTFVHYHGPNRKRDQIRYDQQKRISRQMDTTTGKFMTIFDSCRCLFYHVHSFLSRNTELFCRYRLVFADETIQKFQNENLISVAPNQFSFPVLWRFWFVRDYWHSYISG